MQWLRVSFKGKRVWAAAHPDGQLIGEGGRVPIRYSDKSGATIYRAGIGGIGPVAGAKVQELPEGRSADDSPRTKGGRSPSKRKGSSGFGSAGRRTHSQAVAAKAKATADLAAIPAGTHVAFTDGACKGNPGLCGAGAVVRLGDGRILERGTFLGHGTNNIGELTAVGIALDLLEEAGVAPSESVVLHTDSKYSLGVLTQGWKAKANADLIRGLKARLRDWTDLEVRWVAGHVGVTENERADQLATLAAEGAV
jgi:ribonuclease HI